VSVSIELLSVRHRALRAELRRRALGQKAELHAFSASDLYKELIATQKAILGVDGSDDRRDFFDLSPDQKKDADSVVAVLTRSAGLRDNGDGTSTLISEPFGTAEDLCSVERFWTQPSTGCASGVLVASDVVATAGHLVAPASVTQMRFAFGYRMSSAAKAETVLSNEEIYSGRSVLAFSPSAPEGGNDWALVQLDRPVKNHRIAPVRREDRVKQGQGVHVIGFPRGLPLKYAGNARVRDNDAGAFFVANLDAFSGNSGSPVFNSETHEVEGILVRGGPDFEWVGACRRTLVCSTNGCQGHECTRVTEFAAHVP